MRLPNGYGSVYKLSGKRRKPFIARKTIGWSDEGKQIYSTVGYYKTRPEALQALAEYNNDPYDLQAANFTFAQIYEKWYDDTFDDDANRSTTKNYNTAYKHCQQIHNMRMSDIRLRHMQKCIDDCPSGTETARRIKILFNKLYDWCLKKEYITHKRTEGLELPKYEPKSERRAFSLEHIELLWNSAESVPNVPIILMLLYSGVRINELLNLKKEDVDYEHQYFKVRDSKTSSGIRIVPIADKVFKFWKEYKKLSTCPYAVCTPSGDRLTYDNFRKNYWGPTMEDLGMDYIPHEARHTCNSLLIMANVNPTIRKKIIGHKREMDIGESVYGHIYNEELLKAINQI